LYWEPVDRAIYSYYYAFAVYPTAMGMSHKFITFSTFQKYNGWFTMSNKVSFFFGNHFLSAAPFDDDDNFEDNFDDDFDDDDFDDDFNDDDFDDDFDDDDFDDDFEDDDFDETYDDGFDDDFDE